MSLLVWNCSKAKYILYSLIPGPFNLLRGCEDFIGAEEACSIALVNHQELFQSTIALENAVVDCYTQGLTEHGAYISTYRVGER